MAVGRPIDVAERRARLGRRHRLARRTSARDVETVARDLVALHATDAATVYLAVAARMRSFQVAALEEALYQRRSLLRMLGMRRTMFVVPTELAPAVQASSTAAIAAVERRRLIEHLVRFGPGGDDAWLTAVEQATLSALRARGSATASQLSADEPRLRTQLKVAEGKAYQAVQNISTRVLNVLSAHGQIVRGRPRGSWISSQYHWSTMADWLPGGLPTMPVPEARVELVRRWLDRYGPGTVADLKWWTGWTMGQVTAALAGVATEPVELAGGPGLVLAGDVAKVSSPGPWVALLPALDPTVMGWAGRNWYVGSHAPALFDRSGNPGPTVWSDGRIVGGWVQRPDGRVVYRLLEDVGAAAAAAIAAEAERLTGWLGPVRVTPRFRTPLERELSA